MSLDVKIGFIGGGNMAKAICQGMIKKGLISKEKILVSAPSEITRQNWQTQSIKTTKLNSEVVQKCDVIFLTFKPYQLESALYPMKTEISGVGESRLFVSVLAGISCNTLYETLKRDVIDNPRVIRVMPNTPITVLEGCSVITAGQTVQAGDVEIIEQIFYALGKCEVVTESVMTAVTGLTGSGPAYIYLVIEALSDGAVKQGLTRSIATEFAAQTVLGAAKMVLETNKHPAELKDEVCSAGGTTIHGIHALEKRGIRAALMDAVEAAAQRGQALGKSKEK